MFSFIRKTATMHKPALTLLACFYISTSTAQKTDSLIIYYKSDQYSLSKEYRDAADRFLIQNWDKLSINSYTDETDEEEYNDQLSRNRATEVYNYLISKKIKSNAISLQYFGERIQIGDKTSEEGRSKNRRTVITGYQYPRIPPRVVADPWKPVSTTLANGFIITYKPGSFPLWLLEDLQTGEGISMITNTSQMRAGNFFNNTTAGEILSSVLIVDWGEKYPCNLDSPIYVKIPVVNTGCPMNKVKFFNAVENRGMRIWQEKDIELCPEMINGQMYVGMWVTGLCGAINFDFKIDNGCFPLDSVQLMVKTNVKGLNSELVGMNSVYLPRTSSDSGFSILYGKDQFGNANVSFKLYNGKRIVRYFNNQPVASLPYDSLNKSYVLSTDTVKIQSKGLKDFTMLLKVNRDRYRAIPEKNKYQFIYLNRQDEKITVDIYARGKRKAVLEYKNVPVASIPIDPVTGYAVVNKNFLKALEAKKAEMQKKTTAKL
jgi:hypothetical protein